MLCLFASRVINNQSYFKNEVSAVTNLVSFLCSQGDHLLWTHICPICIMVLVVSALMRDRFRGLQVFSGIFMSF